MEARTKIIMFDEHGEKFFGEGPYRLLQLVEETGSLRSAACSMGMAYTKALKITKCAEQALGYPLIERRIGGNDGGGSILSAQGKEWMETYGAYRKACIQTNQKLYMEFFSKQP